MSDPTMTGTVYTNVAQYLAALKAALAGAPPGMIADALADCEEHLRGAIAANPGKSEAEVFAEMAKSYGSPEEVAAEYRAIELPQPGPFARTAGAPSELPAKPSRPWTLFNVASDPTTYGALLYMLLSLATGVFYFTWAVTGLSLSLGLFVLIIGIPFFLLFVGSVRLLAHVEGRIVETLLGVRMPRRLPASGQDMTFFRRVWAALSDLRTWSSLAYMLLMLPLGIVYFVVAVVGLTVPCALVAAGLYHLVDGGRHVHVEDAPPVVMALAHNPLTGIVFAAIGIVLFFIILHLARALGRLHGLIAERLLVQL